MTEIVVAHYNENLDWLKNISCPIHVYSKGNLATIPCIQHTLPNVGREPHTYLTYIIERYDTLPEIVFFTQGRIDDHIKNKNINQFLNLKPEQYHSNNVSRLKPFLKDYDKEMRIINWIPSLYKSELNAYDWFKKYVNSEIDLNSNNPVSIFWFAIFSVRRQAILSRPKEYYEMLLETCNKNSNPEEAHYFERSWYYIFQLDKLV